MAHDPLDPLLPHLVVETGGRTTTLWFADDEAFVRARFILAMARIPLRERRGYPPDGVVPLRTRRAEARALALALF